MQIEEIEIPAPAKGEVQIRIRALGLNRADVMFRTDQYLSAPRLPARPGYEAAGTVSAIGEGVTGFKIGDAVSVIPGFDLNDYGLYGDLANAPANLVVHHPATTRTWKNLRRRRCPNRRRFPENSMSSVPPSVPIFRADHPFLFAIRDRKSGSILFLGRITDPTRQS